MLIFKKSYNYSDQQAIDFWDQIIRNKSLIQQADKIGIQSSFDHLKDYLSKIQILTLMNVLLMMLVFLNTQCS